VVRALGLPRIFGGELVDALRKWMRTGKTAPRRRYDQVVLRCKKCGHMGVVKTSLAGHHIRADCQACGRYIKFLPQD
jgi:transcription elongation factor Elf1